MSAVMSMDTEMAAAVKPVEMSEGERSIRAKIMHVLGIWPMLTSSMLQNGMGVQTPARDWRPVLSKMRNEGLVLEDEIQVTTHLGQVRSYTRIFLATNKKLAEMASANISELSKAAAAVEQAGRGAVAETQEQAAKGD